MPRPTNASELAARVDEDSLDYPIPMIPALHGRPDNGYGFALNNTNNLIAAARIMADAEIADLQRTNPDGIPAINPLPLPGDAPKGKFLWLIGVIAKTAEQERFR